MSKYKGNFKSHKSKLIYWNYLKNLKHHNKLLLVFIGLWVNPGAVRSAAHEKPAHPTRPRLAARAIIPYHYHFRANKKIIKKNWAGFYSLCRLPVWAEFYMSRVLPKTIYLNEL